jgi:hypothetical protein
MRKIVLISFPPSGVTSPMGLDGGVGIKEAPGGLETPACYNWFLAKKVGHKERGSECKNSDPLKPSTTYSN